MIYNPQRRLILQTEYFHTYFLIWHKSQCQKVSLSVYIWRMNHFRMKHLKKCACFSSLCCQLFIMAFIPLSIHHGVVVLVFFFSPSRVCLYRSWWSDYACLISTPADNLVLFTPLPRSNTIIHWLPPRFFFFLTGAGFLPDAFGKKNPVSFKIVFITAFPEPNHQQYTCFHLFKTFWHTTLGQTHSSQSQKTTTLWAFWALSYIILWIK